MATIRSHLAITASLVLVISLPTVADQAPAGGNESLGGRLLDDLPQGSNPPVATPHHAETRKSKQEIEDSLKASTPLRAFGVRANPIAQPLARVQGNMKQVQGLLANPVVDTKTGTAQLAGPVQQEIISDLDK